MPSTGTIVESITVADAPAIAFYGHNIDISQAITVAESIDIGPTVIKAGDKIYNMVNFDADYNFTEMFVQSVIFVAGAANDHVVLREGSLTGPVICDIMCPTAKHEQVMFDRRMKIYIDVSEGVFSAGARLIVLVK